MVALSQVIRNHKLKRDRSSLNKSKKKRSRVSKSSLKWKMK